MQEAANQYVTEGTELVDAELLEQSKVYMQYANACYYIQVRCSASQGPARMLQTVSKRRSRIELAADGRNMM